MSVKNQGLYNDFNNGCSEGITIINIVEACQEAIDPTVKHLNHYFPFQDLDGYEMFMTPLEAVIHFARKDSTKTKTAIQNLLHAGAEMTEYAEQAVTLFDLNIEPEETSYSMR